MKKLLYISELDPNGKFGGAVVEKKNCEFLSQHYDVEVVGIYAKGRTITKKIVDVFFSKVPTLYSFNQVKQISKKIRKSKAKVVFIETTKMGYFAKLAKKHNKKVITFVHNCEVVLYSDSRGKIYVPLIKKQEKLSVEYSDIVIFLNERDKTKFKELYGESGKSWVQPICLDDRLNIEDIEYMKNKHKTKIGLFLGSLFPPNYNGIKYFVENVAPKIDAKVQIVGLNFEKCKELTRDNVDVIGTVEDTKEYLLNADFVILPIFEGSGMKVKTCECMMYGKNIFATNEALEGYKDIEGAFYRCNTTEEFIYKIGLFLNDEKLPVYNGIARQLYIDYYSSNVFCNNMAEVINSLYA